MTARALTDRLDDKRHTIRTAYTANHQHALAALGWTAVSQTFTTTDMRSPTPDWERTGGTIEQLINYLKYDPPGVDVVRTSDGSLVMPVELWLPDPHCWIIADASAVYYGWKCGITRFPRWLTRWRLRRAVRSWLNRHYEGLT